MSLRLQSSLDISEEALQEISSEATRLVFEYLTTISDRSVRAENYAGKTIESIATELTTEGVPLAQLLDECRAIMDLSRHNGHPRFFGYVASPSTPIGAYGDLIASALNANITCWRSGPAGTELERMVVRWLGSLINYDRDARGLLTSGGSMANMIALLVGNRRKTGADASKRGLWNSGPPMTIYASSEAHMSIAKAADILGFGRDHVRLIPCDDRQRIRVDLLREKIEADRSEGLRPFCVVGSAGTVNTGVVDPLSDLASIAAEFDLWFHVDGAYGAPGVLDERKRHLFAGLERADSVSLDPHKWLYVPVDAGCLLFRDTAAAKATFSTDEADYIKTHGYVDEEAFAFWDYGVELSRCFRALKIWLTLQYYGSRRIAEAISEDISLAEYLGEVVSNADDFELLAPLELSICCFRYVPANHLSETELDKLNERIMERVQKGGRAYLSNATVGGHFALRACITNFRTTKNDIDQTIAAVREAAEDLTQRRNGAMEDAKVS
ncbi:MAG TPA: aminotransferase class V-fold PLP-dependent enzyme [Pyrinomonadaceae bacterium]|jgi:glutamate/tyrosine decarboxylase-like PLP-dependent enzyme|nr:aminotransferase class V-fold PLP-dependent enzyme [Pyrinomonadaceae bacterium]